MTDTVELSNKMTQWVHITSHQERHIRQKSSTTYAVRKIHKTFWEIFWLSDPRPGRQMNQIARDVEFEMRSAAISLDYKLS